jgi:hypothetical protein
VSSALTPSSSTGVRVRFIEWLEKVHAIKLGKITPAKIQEWKHSFLAAAGNDPLALRKARISVNTFLRRSRSLFSRKVLRQLQLSLPSPYPLMASSLNLAKA